MYILPIASIDLDFLELFNVNFNLVDLVNYLVGVNVQTEKHNIFEFSQGSKALVRLG